MVRRCAANSARNKDPDVNLVVAVTPDWPPWTIRFARFDRRVVVVAPGRRSFSLSRRACRDGGSPRLRRGGGPEPGVVGEQLSSPAQVRRVHRHLHGHPGEEPVRPGARVARARPGPVPPAFFPPSFSTLTSPTPSPPRARAAVWYLKARALTLKNWIDDDEIEEEVRARPRHPLRPPRVRWRFSNRRKHLRVAGRRLTALVDRRPRSCRSPFTSFPQGVAEVLLDENATAQMPRPGTSLMRPNTAARAGRRARRDSPRRRLRAARRPGSLAPRRARAR